MTENPQARLDAATAQLLSALAQDDPTSPETVRVRAEHSEALLAVGAVEDAFYAAEELVKDALRAHGEGHPAVARAREALTAVEQVASSQGLFRR